MPVLALGDRKNGVFRSEGFSSIQTLSSFCQSVNRPSTRVASFTISAKGRRLLLAEATWAAAPPLGADALAAGAGALPASPVGAACALRSAAWVVDEGAVAQPASTPITRGEVNRAKP